MGNIDNVTILTGDDLSEYFGSEEPVDEQKEKTEPVTDGKPQESGSDGEVKEKTPSNAGVSPTSKYSSIATALREEGVFPDLTDEEIAAITDAQTFKTMFVSQSDKRLTAQQKRVNEALNYGVKPTEVQMYEQTLQGLFSIKDEVLTDEENGDLRKQLIAKDLQLRGYDEAKIKKELEKSLNSGTDIDDAKEALESLKQYYHNGYEKLRNQAKKDAEDFVEKRKKNIENLKNEIDSKESAFGALPLTPQLKKQIYDTLVNPVVTLPDGQQLTALQQYEREHHNDFLRYVGAFYVMTDGFKDFSKMFKPVARQAVKSGFAKLEDLLQGNSNAVTGGNMSLRGGTPQATGSEYFTGNWKIDFDE